MGAGSSTWAETPQVRSKTSGRLHRYSMRSTDPFNRRPDDESHAAGCGRGGCGDRAASCCRRSREPDPPGCGWGGGRPTRVLQPGRRQTTVLIPPGSSAHSGRLGHTRKMMSVPAMFLQSSKQHADRGSVAASSLVAPLCLRPLDGFPVGWGDSHHFWGLGNHLGRMF
jgi:hypothetical protein